MSKLIFIAIIAALLAVIYFLFKRLRNKDLKAERDKLIDNLVILKKKEVKEKKIIKQLEKNRERLQDEIKKNFNSDLGRAVLDDINSANG